MNISKHKTGHFFIALFLCLYMMTTVMVIPTFAAEDYRGWSQSDSRWGSLIMGDDRAATVSDYGCASVSMAKILVQSGAVGSGYTPATFVNYMNKIGNYIMLYNKDGSINNDSGSIASWPNACKAGTGLSYNNKEQGTTASAAVNYVKKGYYCIVGGPTKKYGYHYCAVDNAMTLSNGYLTIMNSWSNTSNNINVKYSSVFSNIDKVIVFTKNGTSVNYLTIQHNANGGTVAGTGYSVNSAGMIQKEGSDVVTKWENGKGGTNGLYNASTFGLTREGYLFAGWCLNSDGSGTIFDQDDATLTSDKIYPGVKSASATVTLYAVWQKPTCFLVAYSNDSEKNYLYQSDFSTGIDSDYWFSRDTAVSTLSVDSVQTHNGYNSLKIVNQSAGALGKDLAIQTLTQQDSTNGKFIGDNRSMVLSFWAKSSASGSKMFFRWGYEPVTDYRSVTLTQEWQYYTLPMDKIPTFGQYIHPYIDKAGTVWLSEIQLEDGTEATAFVPEQNGPYMTLEQVYGNMQKLPPEPERDGYQFDGWYTQAVGGSQLTELQQVQPGNIAVYAHWSKLEENLLEISHIQKSETGMEIQLTGNPDQDVQLVVAAYSKQGAMLGTSVKDVNVADIEEGKVIPIELDLSKAACVTAFVLTNDGSMTPLTEEKRLAL